MGFDAVRDAVANKTACLVFTAGDISPKSLKETKFIAEKHNIEHIAAHVTMDEISFRLGRRVGILAVSDKDLANAVRLAANRENEEEQLI